MSAEMRVRYKQLGGHVHCRIFTRELPTETWAFCGSLAFRESEWNDILLRFKRGGAAVLPEEASE